MTREQPSLKKLPDEPGVYFFVGQRRQVLYVGKATSLKDRVRSYFSADLAHTRGPHMSQMVERAHHVEFRETDSVLEALVLEAKLIKTFKPLYNTRDKDDKSFNHLVITKHEAYPRVLTVRGKELQTKLKELGATRTTPVYGPFPYAGQFKEALKIIRKIFPYYDCTRPVCELMERDDRKLRFNQSIGVYPDTRISAKEYARTIRHIQLFFEGNKSQVVRSIEREMHAHARKKEFEDAARCKRQLFALRHIEDVSLIRREPRMRAQQEQGYRLEGYDVAHLQGRDMVGVMTVVVDGAPDKRSYRTFTIRSVSKSNDTAALTEVLSRRLAHPEWLYPRLIVADGGTAQLNAAKKVLAEAGVEIPVVAVTKDERHRPKRIQGPSKVRRAYEAYILLVNAEAHRFSLAVHTRKRRKRIRAA